MTKMILNELNNMKYDYKHGYCSINFPDYPLRKHGKGCQKYRYHIIKRDGKQTIVHENVTSKQLIQIKNEIIKQRGESAWWG